MNQVKAVRICADQSEYFRRPAEPHDQTRDPSDFEKAARTRGKIDKNVTLESVVEPKCAWIKGQADEEAGSAQEKPFDAFRDAAGPKRKRYSESKLR